jgi:hypothetical protein
MENIKILTASKSYSVALSSSQVWELLYIIGTVY